MDHNVAIVGDDPLALRKSVHDERFDVVVLPKTLLQFVGDRFEVWLTRPGADQEEIGERGNAAQVDGDNAFRLFIGGYFGTELSETFGVDGSGTI